MSAFLFHLAFASLPKSRAPTSQNPSSHRFPTTPKSDEKPLLAYHRSVAHASFILVVTHSTCNANSLSHSVFHHHHQREVTTSLWSNGSSLAAVFKDLAMPQDPFFCWLLRCIEESYWDRSRQCKSGGHKGKHYKTQWEIGFHVEKTKRTRRRARRRHQRPKRIHS